MCFAQGSGIPFDGLHVACKLRVGRLRKVQGEHVKNPPGTWEFVLDLGDAKC